MTKQGISTDEPNDWIGHIWVKYASKIYKLCTNRTQSEEDAKDLFQDVALKFCKNACRLRLEGSLDGWFASVIRTTFYDGKRRIFEEIPMSCLMDEFSLKDESGDYDVFSEGAAMFFSDDSREQRICETVDLLLENLTPAEKYVVEVSYFGGFTLSEMSRDLGTSRCVLWRRRNDALVKMRKSYGEIEPSGKKQDKLAPVLESLLT